MSYRKANAADAWVEYTPRPGAGIIKITDPDGEAMRNYVKAGVRVYYVEADDQGRQVLGKHTHAEQAQIRLRYFKGLKNKQTLASVETFVDEAEKTVKAEEVVQETVSPGSPVTENSPPVKREKAK